MNYDSDKTPQILEELREAVYADDYKAAVQLLRYADSGGRLRSDPGVLKSLQAAVGAKHAAAVVRAFASDECRYCAGGRDRCRDCGGKGYGPGGKLCGECSGLGVTRCPFCNGTGFAGYDFVPRGLQPAVLAVRVDLAERRLAELIDQSAETDAPSAALARRMLDIDRCRGVLANAVEQARLYGRSAPNAPVLFSSEARATIEMRARHANAQAERTLRQILLAIAQEYAARAQRTNANDRRKHLYAHHAKTFAHLSGTDHFTDSALQTPQSLRNHPGSKKRFR